MKTKQMALDALKIGRDAASEIKAIYSKSMAGYKQELHAACAADVAKIDAAIAALEADIAAKVEPVGWLKEHRFESGYTTHTFTEDREHVAQWARAGIALKPVYSEPQQAEAPAGYALAMAVLQSDLYHKLDDLERAQCDALIASPRPAP